jgi:hypothetical protein
MKIDPRNTEEVKNKLAGLKFREWTSVAHGIKSANEKITITIYNSGSVVINGKNTAEVEKIFDQFRLTKPIRTRWCASPKRHQLQSSSYKDKQIWLDNSCYLASDEALTGNLFGSTIACAVYIDLSSEKAKSLKNLFNKDPQHSGKFAPKDKLDELEDINTRLECLHKSIHEKILAFACVTFDADCKSGGFFDISGFNVLNNRIGNKSQGLAFMHLMAASHLLEAMGFAGLQIPNDWCVNAFDDTEKTKGPSFYEIIENSSLFKRKNFAAGSFKILPPCGASGGHPLFVHELPGEDYRCVGINVAAYISGLLELRHISRCFQFYENSITSVFDIPTLRNHSTWTTQKKTTPSATDVANIINKDNWVKCIKAFDSFKNDVESKAKELSGEECLPYTVYNTLPCKLNGNTYDDILSQIPMGTCFKISTVL